MGDIILMVVVGILILAAWLLIPVWRMKRNIREVVHIFQENDAIGIQNAKTIEDLRIKPKSMLQRLFSGQDWKSKALNLLIQTKVVEMTEDRKLYITEESLTSATWLNLNK